MTNEQQSTLKEEFTITDEMLQVITRTAISEYERAKKEEACRRKEKRLHNVKLLMENYIRIKQSITEVKEYEEQHSDLTPEQMMSSEYLIASLNESRIRSRVMIDHVNKTLEVYRFICDLERVPERYGMLIDKHVHNLDVWRMEEKYSVSRRTVYRQLDEAYQTLSVLLFGIDAVGFEPDENS